MPEGHVNALGRTYPLIHGQAKLKTPTYISWMRMRDRCNNKKHHAFGRYGGAGVRVCERWDSFVNFLEDMGERPPGTSLDRLDNSKGYCKENCRWATEVQQQRNRRTNVLVTINGQTRCVSEWAELTCRRCPRTDRPAEAPSPTADMIRRAKDKG